MKKKIDNLKISEILLAGIRSGTTSQSESKLQIPQNLPSSNGRHCSNLQIIYELFITAYAAGFHKNVSIAVPVTIISKSSQPEMDSDETLLNSFDDGEDECIKQSHNKRINL